MLVIISPAKTMRETTISQNLVTTVPIYKYYAEDLVRIASSYSVEELANVLNISLKQASVNSERYKDFLATANKIDEGEAAILQYDGIVYKHLLQDDFGKDDFNFAQKHFRITSFIYGLLRPLDLIKPYRMEGIVKLKGLNDQTIFNFWYDKLTEPFLEEIKDLGGVLINLASSEMKKLFQWKRIEQEVDIVTPEFRIYKNGVPKNIATYSKMARGEMARYIIRNQIYSYEEIKTFEWDGFVYDKQLSSEKNPIFSKK